METIEPWVYGDIEFPQCCECARLRSVSMTCDAFPDGIPRAIYENVADHREPYDGDRGIRWIPDSTINSEGTHIIDHLSERTEEFLIENNYLASLAIKRRREARDRELQVA